MHMTRRQLLAVGVGTALAGLDPVRAEPERKRPGLGVVIHSHTIRQRFKPTPNAPDFNDPLVYLDHCAALGAAGIQMRIGARDAAYLAKLRGQAEKHRMYLEGMAALPRDAADVRRFEADLRGAREAGAAVVRTVTLASRRYETFDTTEAFRSFAKRAWESLRLAEPVAARQGVRLAVENHKDWRADELVGMLKRLDSAHVGVCLDTGNSIALLEDPLEVVKAYAPWAFTTHFKDMGVSEYAAGFLLAEVPLGEGFLDLKQMLGLLEKAGRGARINLEMITRDPLQVPCLGRKYWATFEDLPGRYLAETLTLVRAKASPRPLAVVSGLPRAEQLRVEDENVRHSLRYAAATLGL
jgi:sugar phosphate isomerase/epimerase